ncbi:hypothetical protein M569_14184, partial [Genlisea aurea]
DIDDLLRELNKPYVKSINSPDGDIIDCVDIRNQPSFDDPAMKNRTIEFIPGDYPEELFPEDEVEGEGILPQTWQQAGSCPDGTIPIRRTTREDVIRARSMIEGSSFARKKPNSLPRPGAYSVQADAPPNNHERAMGYMTRAKFFGGKAAFSVWKPIVQSNEFSLAQLWVMADDELAGPEINSVEAGWQVYPGYYGDGRPRFFNYWTRDDSVSTGCYDLKCKGFVQTSSKITLGGVLDFSAFNGRQVEISIYIFKGKYSKDWWLQVGNERVGYWPNGLFTSLSDTAYTVQWGGEVIDTKAGGQHTTTQMGSGHFPEEGYKRAAYIRDVRVVDYLYAATPANGLQLYSDDWKCYGVDTHVNPTYGIFLYYGGPGRNANCP